MNTVLLLCGEEFVFESFEYLTHHFSTLFLQLFLCLHSLLSVVSVSSFCFLFSRNKCCIMNYIRRLLFCGCRWYFLGPIERPLEEECSMWTFIPFDCIYELLALILYQVRDDISSIIAIIELFFLFLVIFLGLVGLSILYNQTSINGCWE